MKAVFIVLSVCCVAVLGGITDEQKAKLREYQLSCVTETGVDPVLIENAKKGDISDDEKLACFANCILQKIGIINADGNVDWDVARAKVPPGTPQEQVDIIYNKCQNIGGTGCEKGSNLFKCFLENKHFTVLS